MAGDLRQEIANYLLNYCFVVGNVDATREKYYYIVNNEEAFRKIFQPLGYSIVVHRHLRVVQLVNSLGSGKLMLRKYESIVLLILRLLYIEKRESLKTNEAMVTASVEEIKNEYEKLNLPKKLDKKLLDDSMVSIKKYNLAMILDKLNDTEAKIHIYPSIMLAMQDDGITNAYNATKEFLLQYKNSRDNEEEIV